MNSFTASIGIGRGLFKRNILARTSYSARYLLTFALKTAVVVLVLFAILIAIFVPFDMIKSFMMGFASTVHIAGNGNISALSVDDGKDKTTKPICVESTIKDQMFAACPSYVIDYAKTKDGEVPGKVFNIFKGLSETNEEQQIYTANPQNIRIEDGSLVLEARQNTQVGPLYTSARVDTKNIRSFQYGKLVVRAKMPIGKGTWPAIWMLPSNPRYADLIGPGESAHLADGEIDIAESIGRQPNMVYSVSHSLSYDSNGVDRTYFNTVMVPNNHLNYHDYEVEWTPSQLTFKVDGKAFHTYRKPVNADYRSWPYDQPYYLVMNLAIGGSWAGKGGIDATALPASLRVQSVQYYRYTGPR